jgi:nicotinate phosphoribosyltransferase
MTTVNNVSTDMGFAPDFKLANNPLANIQAKIATDTTLRIAQAKAMFGQDFEPIILFLTDTDLYKKNMQQVVLHQFPHAQETEFHFKCRNPGIDLAQHMDELNRQLDWLCTLNYTEYEVDFLRNLRYIKPDYADFLTLFRLQRKYIKVVALENNEIDIIPDGPWVHTIPFEIYVLAIINELYFRTTQSEATYEEGRRRLDAKIQTIKDLNDPNFKFTDFGTRRRYSREWQDYVVQRLSTELPENMTGTSNVFLAMKYGLVPQGTMAHEYLQAGQALGPRLRDSQKFALEAWVQEYRGDLGIALTDVVGTDAFIRDFDLYFCKLFDGVRHDSGNPYEWGYKMLEHYSKMKIDARTKSFVFSDGLNVPKAIALYQEFKDKVKVFFGIGTDLTNDLGPKALNIVLKMTVCNGSPVAKVSDEPSKTMCHNQPFLDYLMQVFQIIIKPKEVYNIEKDRIKWLANRK